MANLTLTIGGRPLKIQCSDDNVETVKEIASSISKLIDDEKKENVPFLTSTLIAYLKSMEDVLKKEKILQDSLNKKLFYESRIQELQNENNHLKSDIEQIASKLQNYKINNQELINEKQELKAKIEYLERRESELVTELENNKLELSEKSQLIDQATNKIEELLGSIDIDG